ncbi:MAG TPA: FtsX-like permease family protein [Candidatus Dormibacteraeota bacterium]|nr:FtsX-like permease family protein [Candidatus Dormibacteraeota bacterium]
MTAVLLKAMRDLRRRRLQAAVIFVTTLLAVGTGTMALTLIAQTRDPYQLAFDAQKGAHLKVAFDGRIDPGTIAGTPALIGATAYGGPYRATDVHFQSGGHKYVVTAVGRDNPGGNVGQLRIAAGHWPSAATDIALTRSFADLNHISIGARLKVVSLPQEPVLTVVAEVVDIDELRADVGGVQHAWVLGTAIAPLTAKDASFYLMDYRFASDPTSAQLQAHMDTLRASLPPDSVTSSVNYIFVRTVFHVSTQILTGVLVAFSLFALAATAAIVANLVTGIVISAYREIGIMKAVGFTPLQVIGVFVLQIVAPAAVACVLGIPIGTILSQPLLASNAQALGLAYQTAFSPALDLMALVGALLIVAIAALIPALRAGRLKPAVVIANASAPRGHSGRWLRRLASRAGLPRPIVLGLGDAAARPGRAILTLLAIVLGVATVVVALGEARSFNKIYSYEGHIGKVDVVVTKSPALADADATQLINSQPETMRVVTEAATNINVSGIADPVNTLGFRGDSAALGYLISPGHWFTGPGEVVANRGFVQDAHLNLGDTFTGTVHGQTLKLRIVGEVFDFTAGPGGHVLMLDWSTITAAVPDLAPSVYRVTLKPGSNLDGYVKRLAAAQPDLLDVQANSTGNTAFLTVIAGVLFGIAAIVALIAIAGVFNTMLLSTRERVRDTATLKTLGMSPRQVIGMVTTTAGFLALVGGLIAVPAGVALYRMLFDQLSSLGGNITPLAFYDVYAPWELIAIPLGGIIVAVVAAGIPGRWAARTNVVEVLHAE